MNAGIKKTLAGFAVAVAAAATVSGPAFATKNTGGYQRSSEGLKHEYKTLPRRVEGASSANWILMDYLDVVVHIFTPEMRAYYRLEELWGEAPARLAREHA